MVSAQIMSALSQEHWYKSAVRCKPCMVGSPPGGSIRGEKGLTGTKKWVFLGKPSILGKFYAKRPCPHGKSIHPALQHATTRRPPFDAMAPQQRTLAICTLKSVSSFCKGLPCQ